MPSLGEIISRALTSLDARPGRDALCFTLLLSFALAASSIAYHHGGILHPEMEVRFPYFLSDRPLANKLFDSKTLDGDMYQAREMSYLFDYIDGKFIVLCIALGFPHFLSLTHYLFSIAIGCLLWHFSARQLGLKSWAATGLVLLFWTSPTVFLGGMYLRTAKAGVALTMVILYSILYEILRADRQDPAYRLRGSTWAACFALSWMATLFDRQGVLMVGGAILFLLIWLREFPGRNVAKLGSALVASLCLSYLYNHVIAPAITLSLNHYRPNFAYQSLPWEKFMTDPLIYIREGMDLYVDTLRFLIGDAPKFISVLLILVPVCEVVVSWAKHRGHCEEDKLFLTAAAGLILNNVVLMCAMLSVMALRHPPLAWPDVRRIYYWLPLVSVLCMTIALWLSRLLVRGRVGIRRWLLLILIAAAIVGNVAAIPEHMKILRHGHLRSSYESAPRLLERMKKLGMDAQRPIVTP